MFQYEFKKQIFILRYSGSYINVYNSDHFRNIPTRKENTLNNSYNEIASHYREYIFRRLSKARLRVLQACSTSNTCRNLRRILACHQEQLSLMKREYVVAVVQVVAAVAHRVTCHTPCVVSLGHYNRVQGVGRTREMIVQRLRGVLATGAPGITGIKDTLS